MTTGFSIRLLPEDVGPVAPGCRYGEIRIGTFRERFAVPIGYWTEREYKLQWFEAVSSILSAKKTALITSMSDPSHAPYVRWWAMYPDGNSIQIQEQICFLDQLSTLFDPSAVEDFVEPRQRVSEDGEEISEWTTSLPSMRLFLVELEEQLNGA